MARKDADMTQGSIWRHYLGFAIPLAIGLLFQQLYNTVDSIVVGQYVGEEALAAVGSTGSIVNMLISLCNGLSMGASVVISQAYGAKDEVRLRKAVHTSVAVGFILCVFATIVGRLLVRPMLVAMQTPENVINESTTYLEIYFSGISGLLMYNIGSAILRAVGDSRRPLYFLIFSACLNTVLDLLFVLAFDMGVAGVALATIMAQGISAILVLYVLTKEKGIYGIRWKELGISVRELKDVASNGAPAGVQQALTAFSNVFVQSAINAFGSACMAGWNGYNKIDAFMMVPAMAIAQTSTTFVGQNWGAKNPNRARKGVRFALMSSLTCLLVLGMVVMIFADPLMHLFTPEQAVIDYGIRFLRIITPFYVTMCFNQIFSGALRGIGQSKIPMVVMLFSFVLFRQAYLYVSGLMGWGFVGVALAYPMGWVVCSTLITIAYFRSTLHKQGRELATNT